MPGLLSTPPLDLADAERRLRELRARRRFAAALRAAADVGAGELVSAHA